jgi:phosphoribosylformimino-5-aminoimidazole carboxamide ribotide isomerase
VLIVPAVDLLDGRAVRLLRGSFDDVTDYGDPRDALRRWRDAGAHWVHVVDLNGARSGRPVQLETIRVLASTGTPLQVGGGVRTIEDVNALVSAGVERVVIGTAAIEDEEMLTCALERHGDRIVVALDARDGWIVTRGWEREEAVRAVDLAGSLANLGVARFLCTDVQRDGTLTEPNYEELASLRAATRKPIVASGGVSSHQAIRKLAALRMDAAIVGRALYDGVLDLAEAQRVADAG